MIPHSKPFWGEEEVAELTACARSLQLKGGPRVQILETDIARDLGYKGAVATVTGSQAIQLALRAHSTAGEPVACQSYVCRSVYDAIALAGCEPRLMDIDAGTFSISFEQVGRSGIGTVIVPHMFGIRAPLERFMEAGLFVIEDCAQRLAPLNIAAVEPRPAVRVLSFEATKLLTSGEGGLLLSDDVELLHRARQMRDAAYDYPFPAPGLRPTDLQAAVARAQWSRLPGFLARRREIAELYLRRIEAEPAMHAPDTYHFRFVLRTRDAETFIRAAAAHGVTVRRPVAPVCLHTLFRAGGDFPESEAAAREVVSLPIYPALTGAEAERVAEAAVSAAKLVSR